MKKRLLLLFLLGCSIARSQEELRCIPFNELPGIGVSFETVQPEKKHAPEVFAAAASLLDQLPTSDQNPSSTQMTCPVDTGLQEPRTNSDQSCFADSFEAQSGGASILDATQMLPGLNPQAPAFTPCSSEKLPPLAASGLEQRHQNSTVPIFAPAINGSQEPSAEQPQNFYPWVEQNTAAPVHPRPFFGVFHQQQNVYPPQYCAPFTCPLFGRPHIHHN
jgi:hypothetical protein